ncbi:dual specificity protein phosphatase 22-A-like isoform X2 [Hyposmocoma kahamanoa]|uniref:dual specificity protein phosphatase 22-A-like isoform X2 n=1 Tax=Hyposmocoma kahamanoa TaxID=1477025 RepID=UPI000E6DA15D|nr:dual specificity protein phosphatase 22-A-like isoform X2 [Hyposmocoma kahamanoa]
MGNGMNKVLPGLYVGNYRDSKDPVQLEKYKITHILSIHDAARRLHSDKHYLCIMASDSPDQNLTQYFSLCNDFIHAARLRDGNVLIHCLAGMSRSVTVAVAYIMSVTSLSWREALKVVRAGRAVANPNFGFQRQLQDFETYKLVEERRRLKERYPSLALADSDMTECRVMLDSYQTMLNQKTICEGKCAMGRQCPTGVCRTGSKRQPRQRRPSTVTGGTEPTTTTAMKRSPSTLSTTSTMSGYRPRSSPAGLYSYTGATANSRPSRSASGISMTRVTDANGGGTGIAVGGTEYLRRRAASAPATPAISPAPSPPGSPHRGAVNRSRAVQRCT